MGNSFDRRRTLQELEQQDWGEPTYHSSLVRTCHRLRRKPLNEFSVEDLRIMIGQQISLQYLIPLALEHLEADPLAEGDYYPGDLLEMVLKADAAFWEENPSHRQRVLQIIGHLSGAVPTLDEIDRKTAQRLLEEARPVTG
jgi:hypothetical protein